MPRGRGSMFRRFFEDLSDGDPVAIGLAVAFTVVFGVIGLFVLKFRRDMIREDEARAKKLGRKK